MNTLLTRIKSVTPKIFNENGSLKGGLFGFLSLTLFFVFCSHQIGATSYYFENFEAGPDATAEDGNITASLVTIGAWNQLTPTQRNTLGSGGTVQNFDLGICDVGGQTLTANITASGATNAASPTTINTRKPRKWGNNSFYLARQNMGGTGVQYCFEFSEPTSIVLDSREHAYFSNYYYINISAENAGSPVNLSGSYPGAVNAFPAEISGSGNGAVNFNANGKKGSGLWWEATSAGQAVTEVCIQYFTSNGGEMPSIEPFRILIEGVQCLANAPAICDASGYISRWNRLSNSNRFNLENGLSVFDFNTGF